MASQTWLWPLDEYSQQVPPIMPVGVTYGQTNEQKPEPPPEEVSYDVPH